MADEIVRHLHFGRDRGTVNLTRKFNVGQYESFDISVGLSSDKEKDENPKECLQRVENYVVKEFDKLIDIFYGKKVIKRK